MIDPIISLCIPTNGIIEWVFPVLDSIYSQNVDNGLFEVVVTDNGNNEDFHKMMLDYKKRHENLIYKKTTAFMFDNQLEALKLSKGLYFKFINHRALLTAGSLQRLIDIVLKNSVSKPVLYFSCGTLKKDIYELSTFNDFVKTLRRYASWTTGVGIWKEDYKKIPSDLKFDKISPHSQILFSEKKKDLYLIDNFIFSEEIKTTHSKKGNYDLFKAFAVEELTITLNLFINGDISANTLKYVKKDYKKFLCELYFDFVIRKAPCSYDLSGFNDAMGIFYNKLEIVIGAYFIGIKKIFLRIFKIFKRK